MCDPTDLVLKLIEAVKDRPELYKIDKHSFGGTNREIKTGLWKEIADIVNQPVDKCKDRWRNIRDAYLKNLKTKEQLSARGMIEEFREYRYYQAMKFLPTLTRKRTLNSSPNHRTKSRRKQNFKYLVAEQVVENGEEYLISYTDEDVEYDKVCEALQKTSHSETSKIEAEEMELLDYCEAASIYKSEEKVVVEPPVENASVQPRTDPQMTDLDSWLNGIKETLMSLPPVYRARAKKKINDVVSESEINYLESVETKV